MPPLIIKDLHHKKPLSVKELHEYGIVKEIESFEIKDVTPDNEIIRFTLLASEAEGTVSTELIDELGNVVDVIGNVDFKFIRETEGFLKGGVQIASAYFHPDYQGQGLGTQAYEILAKNYLLVSDTVQTHDGAAFWKYKISVHGHLEVQIIKTDSKQTDFVVLDEEDKPVVYTCDRADLEPMIWGLSSPNECKHTDIQANEYLTNENVVLIAIYNKST